jgi:hypothetical protein
MKTRIWMAIALACGLAALGTGCRPGGLQPAPSVPEKFAATQTNGAVRATILELSQLTLFTDKWYTDPAATGASAVPAFKMVFLVDVPKADGLSSLVLSPSNGVQILVGGKAVNGEIAPGIAGGGSGIAREFESSSLAAYAEPPKLPPGRTAVVQETVLRGVRIDADHVDVRLTLTWKKQEMAFEFEDVPVN